MLVEAGNTAHGRARAQWWMGKSVSPKESAHSRSTALPARPASDNSLSSSQRALMIEKEMAKLTPRTQEKYHMEKLSLFFSQAQ
jgi:hypothetical protein